MKKIAIVNDDADFMTAMEVLLEESHYQTLMIHEGNTAYHIIKKEQPDLIILDIRMDSPTTGWKVLDLLTLDLQTSAIPVIICSASAEQIKPEKQVWLEEHGIKVLPKPFDINDLLGMITAVFTPTRKKQLFEEAN